MINDHFHGFICFHVNITENWAEDFYVFGLDRIEVYLDTS